MICIKYIYVMKTNFEVIKEVLGHDLRQMGHKHEVNHLYWTIYIVYLFHTTQMSCTQTHLDTTYFPKPYKI